LHVVLEGAQVLLPCLGCSLRAGGGWGQRWAPAWTGPPFHLLQGSSQTPSDKSPHPPSRLSHSAHVHWAVTRCGAGLLALRTTHLVLNKCQGTETGTQLMLDKCQGAEMAHSRCSVNLSNSFCFHLYCDPVWRRPGATKG
jgi:hypothetical protein